MLRAMGFVGHWRAIADTLPPGWNDCRLRLTLARSGDAGRAARLLGPAGHGRAGDDLLLHVGTASGPATERLLARLDAEGIAGSLELLGAEEVAHGEDTAASPPTDLATTWDDLIATLPQDWSDLLCLLGLRSSDDLGPAALALAPLNPSRHDEAHVFHFRVARRAGYGAAPEMARRCLARLDEQRIPGEVEIVEAFCDTRPLLTQGPTFKVGGRAV